MHVSTHYTLYFTRMILTSSFHKIDDHTESVRGPAWQEGIWSIFGIETTRLQTQYHSHQIRRIHLQTQYHGHQIRLQILPPLSVLKETIAREGRQ